MHFKKKKKCKTSSWGQTCFSSVKRNKHTYRCKNPTWWIHNALGLNYEGEKQKRIKFLNNQQKTKILIGFYSIKLTKTWFEISSLELNNALFHAVLSVHFKLTHPSKNTSHLVSTKNSSPSLILYV